MDHPIPNLLACRLLAVVAAGSLFGQPLRADEPKTDAPKIVSFELLKSKHMAVQVKVNGKGPYRLIFDTGAPMMLVNNKIAKEAGIITKDTKRPPLALFGTMGQFTIKQFEMGELKAENVATVVMDHPTVAMMAELFGPIDGIVGFPFFARYRMTVDYQACEMSFVPNGYKPTNILDALMATMMSASRDRGAPRVLVPAGQWGFSADKGTQDEEPGVDVKEVFSGGAADRGGLKAGDRVLTIDGRWTDSVVDLYEAATHVKPGRSVPVKVKRGGKEVILTISPRAGL
jgi:hypothetical protein